MREEEGTGEIAKVEDEVQEQNKSVKKKHSVPEESVTERNEQNRGTKKESVAREISEEEK